MGHFVYDEVDRIDLGDGEWIDIKREMSVGDMNTIDRECMGDAGRVLPVLFVNIKAWSLKGKDGEAVPVNKKMVTMLNSDTAQLIIIEIGKRNLKEKKA